MSRFRICYPFFFLLVFLILVLPQTALAGQRSFQIEKVAEGVFAALAVPGSTATSNAFIVDLGDHMIVGGAHLTKQAINDLLAAAADITPKPVEAFILTHHHQGFSFVDFDFPPGKTVIMTLQTRQVMKKEVRQIKTQVNYFKGGLTIEGTKRSVVLTNIGPGHSLGDMIIYMPESKTLFTSDLVYVNSAGFLGDGPLRDWVIALEDISSLDADRVIPGFGPVSSMNEVFAFKNYLKEFLTEILRHVEQGDDLYQTLDSFSLPRYDKLPGYKTFSNGNIERAYKQLSNTSD